MIINSIQGGGREVLGSHAALRWGGRDLQSALNRAVFVPVWLSSGSLLADKSTFFSALCSSDWAEQAAPSSALSQCNQALLSPQLPFSPLWFPPIGPHSTQPTPPSVSPLLQQHPPPLLTFDECPFTARRKGHAKKAVRVNWILPQFFLISMK